MAFARCITHGMPDDGDASGAIGGDGSSVEILRSSGEGPLRVEAHTVGRSGVPHGDVRGGVPCGFGSVPGDMDESIASERELRAADRTGRQCRSCDAVQAYRLRQFVSIGGELDVIKIAACRLTA